MINICSDETITRILLPFKHELQEELPARMDGLSLSET
jgi:hypothetical protein